MIEPKKKGDVFVVEFMIKNIFKTEHRGEEDQVEGEHGWRQGGKAPLQRQNAGRQGRERITGCYSI